VPKDVFSQGQLWGWASNTDGNLGDNTTTYYSSPVQTIAGGTNWKKVSGGYRSSTAIKTDGTLWGWGFNGEGTLGTNNTTSYSSPVQTVSAGTNWKQVSCGGSHTGAIKTDGTLWMWGAHYDGELGNNATAGFPNARSSPVQTVSGGTNWKQVSCGNIYTGAIKTDGTLWMWGDGAGGKLGNNLAFDRSSPVQTVAAGTNWKQVSCGYDTTGAIKTDGTLWMWGVGTSGELGDNTRVSKSSPVQTIAAGTNWKDVNAGHLTFVSAITAVD
jgi:alpha-tubulin suppressor-like RCC1 family protein